MLLKELLPSFAGTSGDTFVSSITCQSDQVKADTAFFCLVGSRFDGHDFAVAAIERGASVVIVERDLGLDRQLIVPDTHAAFAMASANRFGRPAEKMRMIGVTGTNGKTSITYMIKKILEDAGCRVGLIGTIQNMIGQEIFRTERTTPDAYGLNELFDKMYRAGCDTVVMEVSSHALDQKRVYDIPFAIGVFTNLTQDHLDYHKTMEGYAAAKSMLFGMCRKAILNVDDFYAPLMAAVSRETVGYGITNPRADYRATNVNFYPDKVTYTVQGKTDCDLLFHTGGRFTVYNSLAAFCVAKELGYPQELILRSLRELPGVKGRAEAVPNEFGFSVILDYAHTPDGLANILSTFRECEKKRLIILFGCGGDRDTTKRPIMGKIAGEMADFVVVTSDNPRSEEPMAIIRQILPGLQETGTPYQVIENRREAIIQTITQAQPGDIVVLAGKGHEDYQILNDRTIHLNEREVVEETYNRLRGERP